MCGITGMVTKQKNGFSKEDEYALFSLMFLNQLRGTDSTGMFMVDKEGKSSMLKEVGDLRNFYKAKDWDIFKNEVWNSGKIVVGHGRNATVGTVNLENAHPFKFTKKDGSHIYLVHNGTLAKHQQLPGFWDHKVDSAWLASCIAEYGAEEALSKIIGAIACVWWDEGEQRIYFYRNSERPLHIAIGVLGDIYFASEKAPLIYIGEKHGLSYVDDSILQFTPNMLVHLDLCDLDKIKSIEDFKAGKIERAIVNFPHPVTYSYGNYSPPSVGELEEDVNYLLKKEYLYIKWDKQRKEKLIRIKRYNMEWDSVRKSGPYDPDMIGMHLDPNNSEVVVREYEKEGKLYSVPTRRNMALTSPSYKNPEDLATVHVFRPGKRCKFRTKHGNSNICHRVLSDDVYPLTFKEYQNSTDGKFFVGKEDILMEVYEVVKAGLINKVTGFLMGPNNKLATCIDVSFNLREADMPFEVIESLGFFKGTIDAIDLTNASRFKETGAVVRIRLRNVTPVYAEGEKKETLQ